MTVGRHEWAERAEEFDYDAMALESEKRLELLKDRLEKAKASPTRGMQELQAKKCKDYVDRGTDTRGAYQPQILPATSKRKEK